MKHHNKHYLELSRKLFNYTYEELPMYSRWIFTVLNELEQKFTGTNKGHHKDQDFFYRSNEELAIDCGLSIDTIKRYKKPLITLGLVKHWNMHWTDIKTGKLSEKKVSAYRILI
jgi:hypothetical protein